MIANEKIYPLLGRQGGYLTTKETRQCGMKNNAIQRMAKQRLIERVAHGLYIGADVFPDPFFVAQYRCPKGIFSNETALFLHDLSDRDPPRLMMTIPSGWNTRLLADTAFQFFYNSPEKIRLGVCEIEAPSGMKVKVFNVERTLCDCLRNIDKLDRDIVLTALKRYVKRHDKDNAKLLEYADKLKIRDMAYRYLEILE
ncbi:MAG: type IV toxin-antitoxin system AbiEi family antitoxin domain-containing protein [Holophagaceae bacterium]|nr:type IV toxin-antitoxin system AbiEi family antitoxin domain-containing protein [Holophagaceae bacterium]